MPSAAFTRDMNALREVGRFLRSHLFHLLISPVLGFTVVTLLHELAHAAAAIAQGGTVTELSIVPQAGSYGHMRYHFAAGSPAVRELVSAAPYLMWGTMAGIVVLIALASSRLPHAIASTLFLWLYLVPLLDIANAAIGWLVGAGGDLAHALGPPDQLGAGAMLCFAAAAYAATYFVQRRLYGNRALSAPAYVLISAVAGAGLFAGVSLLTPLLVA
jgi:hypothetical protein